MVKSINNQTNTYIFGPYEYKHMEMVIRVSSKYSNGLEQVHFQQVVHVEHRDLQNKDATMFRISNVK